MHITATTFELVQDVYEVENGEGEKRSEYIKDNNIQTYLVSSKKKEEPSSTVFFYTNLVSYCIFNDVFIICFLQLLFFILSNEAKNMASLHSLCCRNGKSCIICKDEKHLVSGLKD